MELVGDATDRAETLDDYCSQKQLSLRQRVELVSQVADAVAYAHQSLIVHGDLKPGNVLVNRDGETKLLDFGAARLMTPNNKAARTLACTPAYASPEQMRGEPITVILTSSAWAACSIKSSSSPLALCVNASCPPSLRALLKRLRRIATAQWKRWPMNCVPGRMATQ